MTTIEGFFASAVRLGPHLAWKYGAREYSRAEAAALVRRVARALIASGVRAGDAVAVLGPNRPGWLLADLGPIRDGGRHPGQLSAAQPRRGADDLHPRAGAERRAGLVLRRPRASGRGFACSAADHLLRRAAGVGEDASADRARGGGRAALAAEAVRVGAALARQAGGPDRALQGAAATGAGPRAPLRDRRGEDFRSNAAVLRFLAP